MAQLIELTLADLNRKTQHIMFYRLHNLYMPEVAMLNISPETKELLTSYNIAVHRLRDGLKKDYLSNKKVIVDKRIADGEA